MPENKIQSQHGMSLNEFIECYGTEAPCQQALERARWRDGFVCHERGERAHSRCRNHDEWAAAFYASALRLWSMAAVGCSYYCGSCRRNR